MASLILRLAVVFALAAVRIYPQTQTINVGGAWSDYPTLTAAVASLPVPLINDVLIVMELGSSGMAEPGFKVDGNALGASGHKLTINGIPKDFNSTQNDLTYYIGDEVEYRVSPAGAVQTIFNYGRIARQVHMGAGSDEAKDFEIQDHLGSIATTVDEGGVANGPLIEYDAYGRQELVVGTASPALTHSFTGKEYDILDPTDAYSAGLYHFGARMYDPDLAMWISPDPAGQYNSPYTYCGNTPITCVDKDGKFGSYAYFQNGQLKTYGDDFNALPHGAVVAGQVIAYGMMGALTAGMTWRLLVAALFPASPAIQQKATEISPTINFAARFEGLGRLQLSKFFADPGSSETKIFQNALGTGVEGAKRALQMVRPEGLKDVTLQAYHETARRVLEQGPNEVQALRLQVMEKWLRK